MLEYLLQYRGKKLPFTTPPIIKETIIFGTEPVWINAVYANTLMTINPAMFAKCGERDIENPVEDVAEIKAKPELEVPAVVSDPEIGVKGQLVCKLCGKDYTSQRFYDLHIARCKGPVDDK